MSEMDNAFKVVEKMREDGYPCVIDNQGQGVWSVSFYVDDKEQKSIDKSLEKAIYLAAKKVNDTLP